MLATAGAPGPGEWVAEPKLDGWRALVYVDAGLCVRTRSGRIVTETLPELGQLVEQVPDGTLLDGELVAGQGRAADFYRLGPRMARRRRPNGGLTFVAFDVLHLDGQDTTGLPWRERRRLLEVLDLDGATCSVPTFGGDPELVLEACARHGLEGLVLKRTDATYRPGSRSRAWRKLKTAEWRAVHARRRHERAR